VPVSKLEGGEAVARACDLGLRSGCVELSAFLRRGGFDSFSGACEHGDNVACFVMGRELFQSASVPENATLAANLFERACGNGFVRACSALGQSYMSGRGRPPDPIRAVPAFEKACGGGYGPACYSLGLIYVRGTGVPRNTTLGEERFRQACQAGMNNACKIINDVAAQTKSGHVNRAMPRP
jgi:TPR repeat protein